ncbi:MAG: helix-hairpin-helix domain-containing protein [Bacteroidales bacterium]|nr:helix-hairpin-helix domain-containing protein [Bacteroidales bacterium]
MKTSIFLAAALAFIVCPVVRSQTADNAGALARFLGAEDEESADSQEFEMLSVYLSHPLDLNGASRSKLLASGLISCYQAASLEDYRKSCGDVLTISELARVDGFGEEFARSLAPFIVLRSHTVPGLAAGDSLVISRNIVARTSFKGGENAWGLKWKTEYGGKAQVSLAARTTYSDPCLPPSSLSGNVSIFPRNWPGKIVAGDFNARFGQGLCLWSGMSMTGFSSVNSFYRRATGVSPSWSYSSVGVHRGLAADFVAGRMVLSAVGSFPGLRSRCSGDDDAPVSFLPAANLSWFGRNGQVGVTGMWLSNPFGKETGGLKYQAGGKVSLDSRWSVRGTDIFGEVAADCYSRCAAFVGGVVLPVGDEWKVPFLLRSYPSGFSSENASGVRTWTNTSNERGVTAGLEKRTVCFTADYAQKQDDRSDRQFKCLLKVPFQAGDNTVITFRGTHRRRTASSSGRTGVRLDCDMSTAGLSALYGESAGPACKARARLEGIRCRSVSGLAYLEAGRKWENSTVYLRSTFFAVDNWDDRIYSYERDAPGSYTVPAYYGRGVSVSAVASLKRRFRTARRFVTTHFYLRASTTRYPWMQTPKDPVSEIKFQLSLDL